MQIQIRVNSCERSDLVSKTFEEFLATSIARFGHRLKHIRVSVEDVNGPRGGVDKHCRCVLHLRRRPPIVIRDRDESLIALVHRVTKRATHALSQAVDRMNRRGSRGRQSRRVSNGSLLEQPMEHLAGEA